MARALKTDSTMGVQREPRSHRKIRVERYRIAAFALTAMSCFLGAGLRTAHASDASALPPSRVKVTLEAGEPGEAVAIHPNDDPSRRLTCGEPCTVTLPPGTYRVSVLKAGEISSRRIHIHESQRLILTPPDSGQRGLGAGLAITGLVIGGAGSLLTAYGMMASLACAFGDDPTEEERDRNCHGPTFLMIGLGGMVTGLALGIPVLVLLVKSDRPRVEVQPYADRAATSPKLYLGLGSGNALTGLSLGARF
jgi:hypothetical protein